MLKPLPVGPISLDMRRLFVGLLAAALGGYGLLGATTAGAATTVSWPAPSWA